MSPTLEVKRAAAVAAAAEAGEPRAMLEIGLAKLQEKDDKPNAEGVAWLTKCVEAASKVPDGETDEQRKARLHTHGAACYALGYAYDSGRGVAGVDEREAERWLAKAATSGNPQATSVRVARRREWRRRRFLDALIILCLVIFVAVGKTLFELCYVLYHKDIFKNEVSGADPATPNYRWMHDAIDADTRAELVARADRLIQLTTAQEGADTAAAATDRLNLDLDDAAPSSEANVSSSTADDGTPTRGKPAQNPLSDSFTHTRGVVAHFTRSALDDPLAFGGPELSWIRELYLDKVLDDRCNAFVFNVLVVPPGRWENRSYGVEHHVDQTLIQSTTQREQSAFTVSVGYAQVPDLIDGGQLELAGRRHSPVAGSVLVFRGDQSHGVSAFCATRDPGALPDLVRGAPCDLNLDDKDLQRVSFVLEQYDLPPHKFKRSPSFILAPSTLEQDLIPILSAFPLGPAVVELWLAIRKRLFFGRMRRRVAALQRARPADPVSPL